MKLRYGLWQVFSAFSHNKNNDFDAVSYCSRKLNLLKRKKANDKGKRNTYL